jgi:hypothetical protein
VRVGAVETTCEPPSQPWGRIRLSVTSKQCQAGGAGTPHHRLRSVGSRTCNPLSGWPFVGSQPLTGTSQQTQKTECHVWDVSLLGFACLLLVAACGRIKRVLVCMMPIDGSSKSSAPASLVAHKDLRRWMVPTEKIRPLRVDLLVISRRSCWCPPTYNRGRHADSLGSGRLKAAHLPLQVGKQNVSSGPRALPVVLHICSSIKQYRRCQNSAQR